MNVNRINIWYFVSAWIGSCIYNVCTKWKVIEWTHCESPRHSDSTKEIPFSFHLAQHLDLWQNLPQRIYSHDALTFRPTIQFYSMYTKNWSCFGNVKYFKLQCINSWHLSCVYYIVGNVCNPVDVLASVSALCVYIAWARDWEQESERYGKPEGTIYVAVNIFIEWLAIHHWTERKSVWCVALHHPVLNVYASMRKRERESLNVAGASDRPLTKRIKHYSTSLSHLFHFNQAAYSLLHVIFHTKLQSLFTVCFT